MKLSKELTEAEFALKKAELRKEQELLDDALKDEEKPKETWLERLEKALDLAEDIYERFKNGDWRSKKQILANLGQDLILKDRQFDIGTENPILRIKKVAKTSQLIYKKAELSDPSDSNKLKTIYANSSKLQGQLKELAKEK